jgi:hypothetical protein
LEDELIEMNSQFESLRTKKLLRAAHEIALARPARLRAELAKVINDDAHNAIRVGGQRIENVESRLGLITMGRDPA